MISLGWSLRVDPEASANLGSNSRLPQPLSPIGVVNVFAGASLPSRSVTFSEVVLCPGTARCVGDEIAFPGFVFFAQGAFKGEARADQRKFWRHFDFEVVVVVACFGAPGFLAPFDIAFDQGVGEVLLFLEEFLFAQRREFCFAVYAPLASASSKPFASSAPVRGIGSLSATPYSEESLAPLTIFSPSLGTRS